MSRLGVVAALLALILAQPAPSSAQDKQCVSNDDCDRQEFEQADKELQALIADKLVRMERGSTIRERVEEAKSAFVAAQHEWVRYRDAECRARVAADFPSARTREGATAICLYRRTRERIEQIKQNYF